MATYQLKQKDTIQKTIWHILISNHSINKGHDLKIHMLDWIYSIEGRSTLHILVAKYTNKNIIFSRGQGTGHMKPSIDHMPQTSVNSIMIQKMIDKRVQPDTFTPPVHTLLDKVKKSIDQLLGTFKSQFGQDETGIGMAHLTKMQIDRGNSEPVFPRPYPISMKHYDWVKNKINKLLNTQVIHISCSSWSVPIIVVTRCDGRKHLEHRSLCGSCHRLKTFSQN